MSDKLSNVVCLPGAPANVAGRAPPNQQLIANLECLVGLAKDGSLQAFIGVGVTHDDMRLASWSDFHNDVYQMLGSLAWLQAEYIRRHEQD